MEAKYCVLVEKIKHKNVELTKSNSEKTKQLKDLEKEKSKLDNVLGEMKQQNYISGSELDFLNVIIFMYIPIYLIDLIVR